MGDYRSPWSKDVRSQTYVGSILYAVFLLWVAFFGIHMDTHNHELIRPILAIAVIGSILKILNALISSPRSIRIGDSALLIRKWIGVRRVPFTRIAAVEVRERENVFESAWAVFSTGGFFGTCANYSGGDFGMFTALTTNDGPLVVLRLRRGNPLVISPERPDDFVRELSASAGVRLEE